MIHCRLLAAFLLATLLMAGRDSSALPQTESAIQQQAIHAPKARKGFLDYALGKINPAQTDYGSQVAATRRAIVEETLDKAFFWSNIFSLLLLASMMALHLLTSRAADKKELIAATLIAELWNGLVSSREEIERMEKDNQLSLTRNKELQQSLQNATGTKSTEGRADARTQRKVDRLIEGPRLSPVDWETEMQLEPGSLRKAGKPSAVAGITDLQQRNVLLERQIEAMRNTEQNLKERLNQTTSLLDQERKRNRTLKGA